MLKAEQNKSKFKTQTEICIILVLINKCFSYYHLTVILKLNQIKPLFNFAKKSVLVIMFVFIYSENNYLCDMFNHSETNKVSNQPIKINNCCCFIVTCNMFNTCNLHSYSSQKHLSVTNMTLFTCEIFFRMSRGVYTEVLISFYSFAVYEVRAEYVSLLLIVRSVQKSIPT